MAWQLTSYAITLAISAVVSIVLSGVSWQWRETRGAVVFAFLMLAIAEWDLTAAFEAAAIQETHKILWSKLSYLGIVATPVLLFVFVLRYTHQEGVVPPRFFVLLWVVPIVTVVLALTNDWHHLIWAHVGLDPDSGKNVLVYDYGAWFWVWLAYAYCLLAVSTFVLIRMSLRYRRTYRLQAVLLLLAVLLPWLGNGLYVAHVGLFSGRDLTPLGFAAGAVLLALNIYYFRLFDLVPIAREAVIESMNEGVLVLDREDRIVDTNPAAFGLLTLDASSVGQRVEEAFAAWPELIKVCCDGGEARCEVRQDGVSPRYLDVYVSPLYDRNERFSGRLMVMSDITTRKKMEQRLRQVKKMEAVGRLAGGIAHEFNNLLTVINGYTEMSLGVFDEDDPVRANLEQVLGAGRRAAELTDRLLTFSRRRAMKVETVNPHDVLGDVEKMLQQVVADDVQLKFEAAKNLGMVRVDRGRLEEVLVNLVINAQDAIEEKGGDGVITIEARDVEVTIPIAGHLPVGPGVYARIEVRDTGAGMSADVRERIFEPFFTTKEVGEGTGLGLAIVYGAVEEFGGGIEVQSEPSEGTSVRIYIPRVE
ncbi:MAG: histidine kinase N-terminal 7TM domain-containing protein [Chloroflexota bacterium]|nr:histidine kinase N-terminal 7TM domain-containing protein [Chloroflexota bacterium]